mgnify:FL=1
MQKMHKNEVIIIKINYEKLKEITKILLNNLKSEVLKRKQKEEKIALFYIDINNKKYYYSYNILKDNLEEVYDSYKVVNYKKAERLLTNQMNES